MCYHMFFFGRKPLIWMLRLLGPQDLDDRFWSKLGRSGKQESTAERSRKKFPFCQNSVCEGLGNFSSVEAKGGKGRKTVPLIVAGRVRNRVANRFRVIVGEI